MNYRVILACCSTALCLVLYAPTPGAQLLPDNPSGRSVELKVASGADDSEEAVLDGRAYVDSSDLELVDDADYLGQQRVGIRFQDAGLPPRAVITNAWIQFTANASDTGHAHIAIQAELSPQSEAFSTRRFDISRRSLTAAAVSWLPGAWQEAGSSSDAQRTPDVAALVQEATMLPGWTERSPITFVFYGTGRRSATSFEGGVINAPRLHVEYSEPISNSPPIAAPDFATTAEETPVTIPVLENDRDPDGNGLSVAGAGLAKQGHTTINADGSITYTPRKWRSGTDTFSYTITDQEGGVATSTVTVEISTSPNAVDDVALTAADTPVVIDVLANDSDAGHSTLLIANVTQPAHGRATVTASGSVLYQPSAGFIGSDSFSYTVSDGMGRTTSATVKVHVGTGFGSARFAVIGDFGTGNEDARAVADLVKRFEPEFIVTVGDNIYGSKTTLDKAVGQFYANYIGNYRGVHGPGSSTNRFFPALGNHDWRDVGLEPYLDYFDFPRSTSRNRRYYDFVKGPVHFFFLDSDELEPDGVTSGSVQANWLQRELAKSIAPWQVVIMHEPPYSSGGEYGGASHLQWPFESWGVDAVFAGHEHHYERLLKDSDGDGRSIPYFVNGSGGAALYSFGRTADADSKHRYSDDFGMMIVKATDHALEFEFWSIVDGGTLIDKQ